VYYRGRWSSGLTDAFVEKVKKYYVPVALDRNYYTQNAGLAFAPHVNFGCTGRIVTANGQQLTRLDDDLDGGLKAFKALPKAEQKPTKLVEVNDYTYPAPPKGGLRLRVYSRPLNRDAKGAYSRSERWLGGLPAETQTDLVWLTKAEREALVPARPKKGDKLPVPAAVFNRICWHHLGDQTLGLINDNQLVGGKYPTPYPGRMTLTVEEASANVVRLRLVGSARVTQGGECQVRFLGAMSYDPKTKEFRRFDLVAIGDFKGVPDNPPKNGVGHLTPKGHTRHLAVAYELVKGDTPLDRLPPYVMLPSLGWADKYYDTGK
jgi:hypothetical protein